VSIGEEATINEMKPLLNAINDFTINVELRFLFVKVLKILLRKSVNRAALGKNGVSLIVRSMNTVTTERHNLISAEMCNLVLNAVYDGKNVQHLIDVEGIRSLFRLLETFHDTIQASALGAIQGVCFVPLGRKHIRTFPQNIETLCALLQSEHRTVRARALGSIHNLSVDIQSIITILEISVSIPAVVSLLRDDDPDICQTACGTLQNLSRDPHGRHIIANETDALAHLTDLLCSTSLSCQVAAIGTLLNLMLSSKSSEDERAALRSVLTDGLVLGAVHSFVFDQGLTY